MRLQILLGLGLISLAQVAHAVVIVDNQGNGDALTIQEGVDLAIANSETVVEVTGGVPYTGALNRSIDAQGVDLTIRSRSGPVAAIDCQNLGPAFVFANTEQLGSVRENLIIQNATEGVSVLAGPRRGTFRNLTISGCGSGIVGNYDPQEQPMVIENCTITNCGTGIEISKATVTGTDVSGCLYGMRIYESSNATITGCTFDGNSVGVQTNPGAPHFVDCSFSFNDGDGFLGGSASFDDCVFAGNSGWGANVRNFGTSLLTGCTVVGNTAGGVRSAGHDTSTQMTRCTVMDNGVVGVFADYGGASVEDSILWGNCGDQATQYGGNPSYISVSCSLVPAGGVTGITTFTQALFDLDPMICTPVQCANVPDGTGDYRIQSGSPAFPTGNPCGRELGATQESCGTSGVEPNLATRDAYGIAVSPNPIARDAFLSFRVPTETTAQVRVLCVDGRLAQEPWVGRIGAGSTTVPWSVSSDLPGGVYFIRLAVGGVDVAETKAVVVR